MLRAARTKDTSNPSAMPDFVARLGVIVLLKSTNSASARCCGAQPGRPLFVSSASLNRVNVRGPCDSYLLSRGGGLGWVPALLKLIGHLASSQSLILRGSAGPGKGTRCAWNGGVR